MTPSVAPATEGAVRNLMRAWNRIETPGIPAAAAWAAFTEERDAIRQHTRAWAQRVAAVGELAANLATFCRDRLK